MTRRLPRVQATQEKLLTSFKEHCEHCGQLLWVADHKHRTITMWSGVWKLISVIRWCNQPDCPNYHRRQYPEEEWYWALPRSKFGLDIILAIGLWHFHRGWSGAKIYRNFQKRGITIAQRSITHWIDLYEEAYEDEKDGWRPSDRMKAKFQRQGEVILSIEIFRFGDSCMGMVRDCLSGEMLLVYFLQGSEIERLPSELRVRLRRVEKFLNRSSVSVKSLIFSEIFNEDKTLISSALAVFPGISYQFHQFHP